MSTVSRRLPDRPHLDVPKREARELLRQWRESRPEALERIGHAHPRFRGADPATIAAGPCRLADAQLVIAREYTFATWTELKHRIRLHPLARELASAISDDQRDRVVAILHAHPTLLHLPLRGGNWGPPLSHAANLGRLALVQAIAALGPRDVQHAFDRALLQGQIDCAQWLHTQGARPTPASTLGVCETLNVAGLRFLVAAGVPLTDERDRRLAPLAMVLETYARHPAAKHEMLALLAATDTSLPDTPMMAFHRGDIPRLGKFLADEPGLITRRFTYREIYPPGLGCADDGRSGLHGTPLDGTTLLHLAIDFDEQEVFDLLLAHGADVNARADVDTDGFGGHTPLFHAVVSCAWLNGRQRDAVMTRALLARGASAEQRASLRKFLDWREQPGWHEARHVTPAAWARGFPEAGWVNGEALRLVEDAQSQP